MDDDITEDDDVTTDDDAATDDDATTDDDSAGDDDTTQDPDDQDGDGHTPDEGDCNDGDPTVYPGAAEVLCDQVDSDCDGWGEGIAAVVDGMEFQTTVSAVAALQSGSVLSFCPGTHTEQVYIQSDLECTLTSFSGDPEDTILDGQDDHTVIYIGRRSSVVVSHLTIQNGQGEPWMGGDHAGGGIMTRGQQTIVEDCVFLDNDVGHQGSGGGIAYSAIGGKDPAEVRLEGCRFEGNTADWNGGAFFALSHSDLTVDIADCTFQDSHSRSAGGAMYVDGFPTHFTITDSTFTGNSTEVNDGGAIQLMSWLTLDISGSTFSDNVAGYDGGALFVDTSPLLGPVATATISDTTFENNSATEGGGGAILALSYAGDTMDFCLDTVVFDGNHADNNGGALDLGYLGEYDASFFDTDFQYNSTNSNAALYFDPDVPSSLTMEGGSMIGNAAGTSTSAMKIGLSDQDIHHEIHLHDVVIEDNVAGIYGRGAIYVSDYVNLTLESCTVARNAGSGAYVRSADEAVLYSINTDWAVFPDDNDPHDVQIADEIYYDDFGAGETFTCTGTLGCF